MTTAEVVQIEDAIDAREERRRVSTMSNMAVTTNEALGLVNQAKVLGDVGRADTFRALAAAYRHLATQADSLREESEDLVVAAMAKAEG